MDCPKCSAPTEAVSFHGVDARRCTHCKGIWFDARKHERLAGLTRSERIDIGSSKLGQEYDKIDRIRCPVCESPMIRMVDAEQPHIHYESCAICGGVFFDAGEFTDYKRLTLMDYLKDLLSGERD